jgi:hypothetical protein
VNVNRPEIKADLKNSKGTMELDRQSLKKLKAAMEKAKTSGQMQRVEESEGILTCTGESCRLGEAHEKP